MVEDLIRRARRRFLLNETLAQSAFAAAVVVGGFALLLIVGTRYMEWWTLAIFAAVGIGVGFWRVYKQTPDPYATAVQLDDNAHLKDALSTAFYFSRHQSGAPEFLRSQREQAEETAGTVRLEQAAPFVIPRSLYAMAALCLLASGLIGLRFGLGHGLDLRAPITQFLLEDQAAPNAKNRPLFPKSQKQWTDEAQSLLSKLGVGQNPTEPSPDQQDALDKAIEQALQNPDASGKSRKGAKKGDQTEQGAADESPDGDPLDNGDPPDVDQSESKSGDKNSRAASGKSANSGNRESLLSRLKDAVSDMLSDADKDEDSSPQKGKKSAKNQQADGSKGKQATGDRQKGQSQAEGQPDGQPDAEGQGKDAQGVLSSNQEKQPGQGNGAGSQNGLKEIREAAQLKAMGKISEIIGQRAATVSGETSVEVQSGNQKLRTAYSDTAAKHGETDGDVTRDEIPLALQAYVQQYFAEVRKAAPAKPKPAAPPQ